MERTEAPGKTRGEDLRRPGERIDDLQRSGLRILQDPDRFCFGMDAVLLSGFVTVKRGEKVTDLCTGTGIIPLLLSAKTEALQIDGIESQPEMADMARRSVMMNGLEDRVRIICGDLRKAGSAGERESRDVVTCNPPYMAAGSGIVNPEDVKALARHEVTCTLEDAVRREVLEETGVRLEVERLGFVQEDFFLCDLPSKLGKVIHELGFYFYMKTPEDFEPICRSLAADGSEERLEWVPLDSERRAYPSFFFSELSHPSPFVRHFVTKEL